MSSILTREREESRASSRGVRDPFVQAVKVALDDADSDRSDRGVARTFLLIDLGAVLGSLLGNRGETVEAVESTAEEVFETQSSDGVRSSNGTQSRDRTQGRSTVRTLFLLGLVVGAGYILRRRMESVDEVVDEATERAQMVADKTAMRSGEAAGHAETVSEEAAERIEETGEKAAETVESGSEEVAERVRETGEEAADQIEEAGETVEELESETEEKAEEMTDTGEDEESEA